MSEEKRLKYLTEIVALSQSGYGGLSPQGEIVDRRKHPSAVPIPENSLMKIPKPIEFISGICDCCGKNRELFKSVVANVCIECK